MPKKRKNSIIDSNTGKTDQEEARKVAQPKKSASSIQPDEALSSLQRENTFFIVGMGASAGGLEAFQQFFSHMPSDSTMAFILVPHLSPDYKSSMVDILSKYTSMKVLQAEDGMQVEQNCVYIKPPQSDIRISRRILSLVEPLEFHGAKHPIDSFFRSLAEDQADKAIGIIFSGAGTDGSLGIKAIKGEGGLTVVQEEKSALFSSMPKSAIATGCVDYILPVDRMPPELIKYLKYQRIEHPEQTDAGESKPSNYLEKILNIVRFKTGHNFAHYKRTTIIRRIEKRMVLNQIEKLSDYAFYLQQHPSEIDALFKEFIIGVTNFFRDTETFNVLKEKMIPRLFEHRHPEHPVRIWVVGCSTGEEAYSIAMLIVEHMDTIGQHFKIQIFATDIDNNALNFARASIYPDNIVTDVSPERLKRFFHKKDHSYAVNKQIREMVTFASHNLIKDPPFSRLDMISCRNLLIYLDSVLHKKLLPLFHYTLNPDGFLILGLSESIGDFTNLFSTIDRKCKVFQRKGISSKSKTEISTDLLQGTTFETKKIEELLKSKGASIGEVTKKMLLESYAPPCVVINEKYDVVYTQGQTSKYLELPIGEPNLNILKMARESLRIELRTAISKAIKQKTTAVHKNVMIKDDGDSRTVNLVVKPVLEPESLQGLMMIVFEDVTSSTAHVEIQAVSEPSTRADHHIKELEYELSSTKDSLRTTIEQLETSNEQLKTSNEMVQAINEELKSANEELETSQEELQSMNEELITVNSELQDKVEELSKANNDIYNMLSCTEIGTIFLDKNLHINRFTPAVARIFNLMEADIGRPIRHISTNITYENLFEDMKTVLKTLVTKEQEVTTNEGKWYLARISPYRTVHDTVEGIVITLVDITERRRAQEDIRLLQTITMAISESEDLHAALAVTLRKVCEATGWIYGEAWIPNSSGTSLERSMAWYSTKEGMEKFTVLSMGFTFPKGAGLPGRVWSLKQPEWVKDVTHDASFLRAQAAAEVGLRAGLAIPVLAGNEVVAVIVFFMFEAREEDKHLIKLISSVASQLGLVIQRKQMEDKLRNAYDELERRVDDRTAELLKTNELLKQEISEHRRTAEQLLKFARAVEQSPSSVLITDTKGNIEYVNPKFTQLTGYLPEEVIGQNPRILKSGKTPPEEYKRLWSTITSGGEWRGEFCNKKKNGNLYWEYASISPIKNPEGVITHFLAVKEDITGRKQTEWEFQKTKETMKRQLEELQKKLEVMQEMKK